MRILIIEDEYSLAELIQNRLKKEQYIVDVSNDGEEGLYNALLDIYDLILLDIMLPTIDGSTFVNNDDGIDFTEPANIINGYGKYIVADTKNDEFPVYYYRGDIGDNNLIFAGFCWKILRTTSTGSTDDPYIVDTN